MATAQFRGIRGVESPMVMVIGMQHLPRRWGSTVLRIATGVFVFASLVFGIVGILFAVTLPQDGDSSDLNHVLFVLLASSGFVVLSSFAVAVAARYLRDDGSSV